MPRDCRGYSSEPKNNLLIHFFRKKTVPDGKLVIMVEPPGMMKVGAKKTGKGAMS
jgi:hypothetical protein